jgi:hypothetical protein
MSTEAALKSGELLGMNVGSSVKFKKGLLRCSLRELRRLTP